MSTSSGAWNIPPPPGTMDESSYKRSSTDKGKPMRENYRRYSRSRSRSREHRERDREREREREHNSRSRSRSQHRNYHRSKRNHRRSRSRSSRDYRRRSRSRSYTPSHKKHNHRRSRSRRHKYTRSRSRSYSRHHRRSRSYSRSRSRSLSSSSYSDRESLYRKRRSKNYTEVPKDQNYIRKAYSKQVEVPAQENTFKNDGSFLEMFKKMQEEKAAEEKKTDAPEASVSNPEVKKTLPIFGKRRGGKVLKTGMVQKLKNPTEAEEEPKDAWSMYMKEVKRYREACCDDDSKTRPLVK